jgi:NitT/TauT family transport system substrate-binding protein
MKTITKTLGIAALGAWGSMAHAADDLTLQLKWVTQAQFAGYYVALEQGFYEEEDLNVTIKPGGPDIAPVQVLLGGGADVMVDWGPSALAAREKGAPIVNIAQPFASSGLMLTCLKEHNINSPADFPGKTLGTWFFGNEIPLLSWMGKLGYATDGSEGGVTIQKINFNVDPLLQKQVECATTMTYNEYWQVIDAGLTPDDLVVFKYEDEGISTLEDGLYVTEDTLADEAKAEQLVRFVRASMKGWKWAEENPDAAADIVLEYDNTGAQTEKHQRRMMGEIAKLTAGSNGTLDPAAFDRTVAITMEGGMITKAPEGAWTHAITDKALN